MHKCANSTVYVPRVQFILLEHSLCPNGAVYFLKVQFVSPEYSLCPLSEDISSECSLYPY